MYHPDRDEVVGWMPNGNAVLVRSRRKGVTRVSRLFSVGLNGGLPTELALPTAYESSYAPGGERLAYMPLSPVFKAWKRYRGGTTSPIWLVTLATGRVEKVPARTPTISIRCGSARKCTFSPIATEASAARRRDDGDGTALGAVHA